MKLYIYDHCPFCVKARMIFGLKKISFELVTLLNDDEATPISMIGKKMVPILKKDDGSFMPESMDIIYYIDNNFGKERIIKKEINDQIIKWLSESQQYLYKLAMPRWVKSDLEEFKTANSRSYFTQKKETYIGSFSENLKQSSTLITQANQHLPILNKILFDHPYPQKNLISETDIHLFAALRSLSIIAGINYPKKVDEYRHSISRLTEIPLHQGI